MVNVITQPGSSTDTGSATVSRGDAPVNVSGPYNPDASFQGKAGLSGSMQGVFVAEETHYGGLGADNNPYKNYAAQAYNLANLPAIHETAEDFKEYAPSTWLQNSAPSQLLQLDAARLGIDPNNFESDFTVNAPSTIQPLIGIANSQWDTNMPTEEDLAAYYSKLRPTPDMMSNPNTDSDRSWYDRVDLSKAKAGVQDIGEGIAGARYFSNMLFTEGGAEALGTGLIETAEVGAVDIAGTSFGLASFGAEGAALGAAEAIGGAAVLGTVGAAALTVGAVGLAAYGAYEFAVGLGAPTISEDISYIGNGLKKVFSSSNP